METPHAEIEWAYDYVRFSSPPQEQGDSVRRQNSPVDAWLTRHPQVRLDKSLKLKVAKVSGYTDAHRTDPRYPMTQFQGHVDSGRVKPGSYLLAENLDRLTRENPVVAIPWVLGLIAKGIRVVQLIPFECVYDSDMDQGRLLTLLWELARGHQESKMKSIRVGEAWRAKKASAREGKPHGLSVPSWLELTDGRYRVKPAAGRAVRSIFLWSAEGLGYVTIAKRLNDEGVPVISGSECWTKGYVGKILTNRAVLGEYQPMKGDTKRVPDGEPIPGYFPAVISESEWYAAESGRKARVRHSGRPSRDGVATSPFAGLLHAAQDATRLRVNTKNGRKHLVSAGVIEGRTAARSVHFPLDHFTSGLLSQLKEVAAADLFDDPGAGQVLEIKGRLGECERRLKVSLARYKADPESPVWADQVSEDDRERRALVAELKEAQRTAASPASASWEEAVELMRRDDPVRLRQCLLATVAEIWCLFVARGDEKLAAVQVWFVGGESRRDYLIFSRVPLGCKARQRRAEWVALSLADVVPEPFDLRDRGQAQKLAAELEWVEWPSADRQ